MICFLAHPDELRIPFGMGRRRQNGFNALERIVPAVAALIALAFISPDNRRFFNGILTPILLGVFFLALILGAIFIFRRVVASQNVCERTEELSPFNRATSPPPAVASVPDVLTRVRDIDWFQFEKLMEAVYRKHGYSVTRRGGARPDGGIDLIVEKEGVPHAVQCKHWRSWNVGVRAVREFLGALADSGIKHGIFVTLCGYTSEAQQLAAKHSIDIVGEPQLRALFDRAGVEHDPELLAILNDPTRYCPKCEAKLVLRTATRGLKPGSNFWGCSNYPRCRYTVPSAS